MKDKDMKKKPLKQNKFIKTEQGITLIALVVTIIILLILAGVAINMALGDNGLFKRSKEAVNTWKSAEANETAVLDYLDREWDNLINGGNSAGEIKTIGDLYNTYGDELIGRKLTYSSNEQSDWIIFGRDKSGNILLTTEEPIANGYTLRGTAEGWLNYEDELNTACNGYGATIKGKAVTSRSINIDDVNYVTGFDKLPVPEWDIYTFGADMDYANKKVDYYYPKLGVTTDGHENWMKVKRVSTDVSSLSLPENIKREPVKLADEATGGELVGEEAQFPSNAYMYGAQSRDPGNATKTASNQEIKITKSGKIASTEEGMKLADSIESVEGRIFYTNAKGVNGQDITSSINLNKWKYVVGDSGNMMYVLASRSVEVYDYYAYFYIGYVYDGFVYANDYFLCNSGSDYVGEHDYGAVPVRPVAVLPSDIQVEKTADFYDIAY